METVIKRKRHGFTMVPNGLIEDNSIKPQVRFLYVYLYSRPDDWEFNRTNICKVLGINKDTLAKYFNNLEDSGWINREQKVSKDGRFGCLEIEIFTESEKTIHGTVSEKDRDRKNRTRKTNTHTNTDFTNTELNNNKEKAEPKNGSLFPELEKGRLTLFKNSLVSDFEAFKKHFSSPEYIKIDLYYYFCSVSDWSLQANKKRTSEGWLATARNWIRKDKENGKLRTVAGEDEELKEYLKMSHDAD